MVSSSKKRPSVGIREIVYVTPPVQLNPEDGPDCYLDDEHFCRYVCLSMYWSRMLTNFFSSLPSSSLPSLSSLFFCFLLFSTLFFSSLLYSSLFSHFTISFFLPFFYFMKQLTLWPRFHSAYSVSFFSLFLFLLLLFLYIYLSFSFSY